MLSVFATHQFKRDLKRTSRQGKNIDKLEAIVDQLAMGQSLAARHRDHVLSGNYSNHRECHINPDWLLVYQVDQHRGHLLLVRTGSHAELFG